MAWSFASELSFYEALTGVESDPATDLFGVPFFACPYPTGGEAGPGCRCAPMGWLETNVVHFTDPDHIWCDPEGKTIHLWMRAHTGGTGYAAIAKVVEDAPGLENVLQPNAPEHKLSAGLWYAGERMDASVSARWFDEFRWTTGYYRGDVESYTTVDLAGNYSLNERWKVGINVANLLDDEHWEAFGGSLLGRRALAHVTYSW